MSNQDIDQDVGSSREEAEANGQKFFFIGENCNNGHCDLRYTSCGSCIVCHKRWSTKRRLEHKPTDEERQRANEYARNWQRKRREDPLEREKSKLANREAYRKKVADPVKREKHNAANRKAYIKKMEDPVEHEKYKATKREAYRKRQQKKKASE